MEILLIGEHWPAPEAEKIGLIGRVVPDGQALAEAKIVADKIAANGPLSIKALKRAIIETEGLDETAALAKELEIGSPIFATEDAKEGATAFKEKRPPVYKGK
jgi:enoyl-CoA hydratase